jgi:delta 1-pyrroline-5-carboxylate dehydrogenase
VSDNPPFPANPQAAAIPLRKCGGANQHNDKADAVLAVAVEALPGPAGETNTLYVRPRGRVARIAGIERGLPVPAGAATATGKASRPSLIELPG